MYNINYCKQESCKKGIYGNILSITIDTSDILMMKYVDMVSENEKNLMTLYFKYLKYCKKNKEEVNEITILNDKIENEKIIASIINCDWLINEGSICYNQYNLEKRKEFFQEQINVLSVSKNEHDQSQMYLMQYFIDTLDKFYKKEEIVKELTIK